MEKKKYLFVVAHPDDEVLAAGATMKKLCNEGHKVYVCIMNSVSEIRCSDSALMIDNMLLSHRIIGVEDCIVGNFETMKFNVTPQKELVQFIEEAIIKYEPDYIFTHHPSDLHNDHHNTAIACKTAVRMPQRGIKEVRKVKAFYYMEVPSSTDWAVNGVHDCFVPNTYSEIEEKHFEEKIKALDIYEEGGVLRKAPHPRSVEMLKAYAMKRGSEIGYMMAESFQMVFCGGV